jgi:hypothetical protein
MASSAQASYSGAFCNWYNAAPYGQSGDRCSAPDGNYSSTAMSATGRQHSACIDAYDQNGALWGSWVCSGGGGATASGTWGNSLRYARGVARNNTTGDRNEIYACQFTC